VEKIFFFKASMAKTQIPTGKNPPAPSCENPRLDLPSQFSFSNLKTCLNICEISVGCTFYADKISVNLHKSFLETLEASTIIGCFETDQATRKDG